ncbi:hypothetical protein N1031_13390 [Herbiconiux moechotypicola]|uniref:Uncharacterized protein n=1 Tax=Herbiconiux moechotypicola TaxID=637393 RepID=A0ABN3DWW5_9MICO|nr:hypothetical protein [Herbiconiux moechotypicola]MCS5730757.1 hypothetical protein [Herbiconiux moechotypicola]
MLHEPHPLPDTLIPTDSLRWRSPQPGLWVAVRADGRPAGVMTERWAEGYQVTTSHGRDLGTFPDRGAATAALERAESYRRARSLH